MNIDFCDKYNMLPHGARVLCALSGGKDSVYMLHKLLALREARALQLVCAHFDHSLRGSESDRDRLFTEALCRSLGLECHTGKADVAAFASDNGLGIEEAARRLRYEFLEETARKTGAERIATAHTADDNIETLLINLMRGSGLAGLGGIPPVRGQIVRPLLRTRSAEILRFLHENKISYVEDSSNAGDDYTRNRLRHHVIPALEEITESAVTSASRCIELLREDEAFLDSLAEDFLREKLEGRAMSASSLSALPRPVAARVIRKLAAREIGAVHVEAVLRLAGGSSPHAEADIPGMRVRREYESLIFGEEKAPQMEERALKVGQTVRFEEAGFQISAEYLPKCMEINNSDNTFFFQNDSICGNISAGPRKEGDFIRLAGRNGTKSLKKLFSEHKLNGARKNAVSVIRDDAGPAAVLGLGIAERCTAQPGDDVICVRVEEIEN